MIAAYVREIMVADCEMPLFLMDPIPMQIAKLQDVWRRYFNPHTGEPI